MFEIGNSLREARLRQGLEFPEIEQATKIRGKYLRALEEEQFEVLPAQTYVKGFLRSYADYLALDGQLYVDEFNSRYVRGEFEDEQEQPYRPRIAGAGRGGGTFQGKAVLLTVALIAGLTVFFFAAWKLGGNGTDELPPLNPPTTAKQKPKPKARLVAWGVAGGSVIVVRRGSRTSKPIYSGTLENGKRQRFVGHRLWIDVYAPANLRLRVNGHARAVPGAGTGARRSLKVTPGHVSLAPAIG